MRYRRKGYKKKVTDLEGLSLERYLYKASWRNGMRVQKNTDPYGSLILVPTFHGSKLQTRKNGLPALQLLTTDGTMILVSLFLSKQVLEEFNDAHDIIFS